MSRDAFILKIQKESGHLKCARRVSGPSRNGPHTRYMFSCLNVPHNHGVNELGSLSDNRKAMTTPLIKNFIGRVRKNKRAARATRTYEQSRAVLCKTTTSNYQICDYEKTLACNRKKIFKIFLRCKPMASFNRCDSHFRAVHRLFFGGVNTIVKRRVHIFGKKSNSKGTVIALI